MIVEAVLSPDVFEDELESKVALRAAHLSLIDLWRNYVVMVSCSSDPPLSDMLKRLPQGIQTLWSTALTSGGFRKKQLSCSLIRPNRCGNLDELRTHWASHIQLAIVDRYLGDTLGIKAR